MIEYHGWLTVHSDPAWMADVESAAAVMQLVRQEAPAGRHSLFEWKEFNGDLVLVWHGNESRWAGDAERALMVFGIVATAHTGSYGQLTFIDTGGERFKADHAVTFRCHRGVIEEAAEGWLTPFNGKIVDSEP